MSLKINVTYKGIIYRVKGIKVLCSVVLAVIILLVAIVAMGVWMLINVHDERSALELQNITSTEGPTQTNILPSDPIRPPSIDFNESEDIVPSEILVHSFRRKSEQVHDNVERRINSGGTTLLSRVSEDGFHEAEEKESLPNEYVGERSSVTKNLPVFDKDRDTSYSTQIPIYVTANSEGARERQDFHDLEYHFKRDRMKDRMQPERIERLPGYMPRSGNPKHTTTTFSRRHGIPARGNLTYFGPPVVGYGSNPYEKYTRERVDEYNNFWRAYTRSNSRNEHREQHVALERTGRPISRNDDLKPHLRGLRPTGVEYDIPVRPDAQTPLKIEMRKGHGSDRFVSGPIEGKSESKPLVPPPPTRTAVRPPMVRPSALGPLQSLYDYSKKLAASLLSFGSKSPEQIRDSSEKLAEYGINLIQNHNQIFQSTDSGPLNRLVELIPNSEKLATLDPFELSLITWTFLDFWEFLIEKVGALSDEDLSLLQKRLERLRKKKDDAMTRVFVNETLSKYSTGKQRSIFHTEDLPININQFSKKDIKDVKLRLENTEAKENTSSITHASVPQQQRLGNLFPTLIQVPVDNSNTGKDKVNTPVQNEAKVQPLLTEFLSKNDDEQALNSTLEKLIKMLKAMPEQYRSLEETDLSQISDVEGRSSNWDPFGIFTSSARMEFMQFAVKVLFNFGKVYLKKSYALDCSMLLFCKDLNKDSRKGGLDSMAAKLKGVGLKVLTESEKELREKDTLGEVWRSVTAWTPLQCDAMFPRCDGPKALEIVNEVALGSN